MNIVVIIGIIAGSAGFLGFMVCFIWSMDTMVKTDYHVEVKATKPSFKFWLTASVIAMWTGIILTMLAIFLKS